MSQEYYSLPLQLHKVITGEVAKKCSLKDSIAQHLHLIITTSFGELQQDDQFGCSIWDTDFDNLTATNKLRENIKLSIQKSVLAYETRLENVRVELFIKEQELHTKINGRQVKKQMEINILANNKITSELFTYNDTFFTGPLSYY
jgi:phage baseplate assembly protein W